MLIIFSSREQVNTKVLFTMFTFSCKQSIISSIITALVREHPELLRVPEVVVTPTPDVISRTILEACISPTTMDLCTLQAAFGSSPSTLPTTVLSMAELQVNKLAQKGNVVSPMSVLMRHLGNDLELIEHAFGASLRTPSPPPLLGMNMTHLFVGFPYHTVFLLYICNMGCLSFSLVLYTLCKCGIH